MFKHRVVLVGTFFVWASFTTVARATALTCTPGATSFVANAVVLSYDPSSGNLWYVGNGVEITSMEIKSTGGRLRPNGVNPGVIVGPFDVLTEEKFFTFTSAPNQVSAVDIGRVLPAGQTWQRILADLDVDGSIYPKGRLSDAPGGGPYYWCIPEPLGLTMMLLGCLALVGWCRKVALCR